MKKKKIFVPVNRPLIGIEELKNVKKCIESGWISSSGAFIKKFEDNF